MSKIFTSSEGRDFAKRTKAQFFKGSSGGAVYSRVFRDQSIQIFPEKFSFDEPTLKHISRLTQELNETFTSTVLPSGFFDRTAISTNFLESNSVAGYRHKPFGYARIGNSEWRREKHLVGSFASARHEAILKELCANMFSDRNEDALGKVAKLSSSGFPAFVGDVGFKHKHLAVLADNIDSIFESVLSGDLEKIYSKYGLLFANLYGVRTQYDGVQKTSGSYVSKPRFVHDIEYALSGGKQGSSVVADKGVTIEGARYSDKYACRVREFNAKASAYNNIGTAAFEPLRSYAEKKYEATWKHRSREEIKAKAVRYTEVLGLDVTSYDQSFPLWLMEAILRCMPLSEGMLEFCLLGIKSPTFYSANGPDSDQIWTGDPLDINYYDQVKGLPSGIFFTSLMGKIGFVFATLCMIDDFTGDVLGNVDTILKHEHPDYAISNMGDDTLLHTNLPGLVEGLKTKQTSTSYGMSEYFVVDVEDGVRFLGNVGYKTKENKLEFCGDLATYFGNMLVPERSLGSKMREFGVYGLLERRSAYSDNPSFAQADEIFQKHYYDSYGISFLDDMQSNILLPSSSQILVQSAADLEVLQDPNKLFYKYDHEDISESILETIESKMDPAVVAKILKAALT